MTKLKRGIGNRAYGQKAPLVEYKKESYEIFTAMMDRIEDETVRYLFFLQVTTGAGPVMPFPDEDEDPQSDGERALYGKYDPQAGQGHGSGKAKPPRPDATD